MQQPTWSPGVGDDRHSTIRHGDFPQLTVGQPDLLVNAILSVDQTTPAEEQPDDPAQGS